VIVDTAGIVFHNTDAIAASICPFYSDRVPKISSINQSYNSTSIIVLTQCDLENYYHQFIEMLLKVLFYIPFLQANPEIAVHLPHKAAYISYIFDLFKLRNPLVSGNVLAANVLLPQGNGCHDSPVFLLQYAHGLILNKLKLFPPDQLNVIFIQRSKDRFILNKSSVLKMLEHYIDIYTPHYELKIFNDAQLPSFE
jgi:hypothetical protein